MADSRYGVLGREQRALAAQLGGGLEERCKLLQWCLAQSPGAN